MGQTAHGSATYDYIVGIIAESFRHNPSPTAAGIIRYDHHAYEEPFKDT